MQKETDRSCKLCRQCTWQEQCGRAEPCIHYEPESLDEYFANQYREELNLRRCSADIPALEQDNIIRE